MHELDLGLKYRVCTLMYMFVHVSLSRNVELLRESKQS